MGRRGLLCTVAWACLLSLCATVARPADALIPADYQLSVRPDPEGVPTRISLGVYLLDLVAIDDLNQEFTADLYFRARWRDPRLASPEGRGDGSRRLIPYSEVWDPAVLVINRRGVEAVLPQTVLVDSSGNVEYSQRVYGQFGSPLDLRGFPADRQTLGIRLASLRYRPEEIEFEIHPATGRMETLSVAGWSIGQPKIDVVPLVIPSSSVGELAGVVFQFEAERERAYYLFTMALPLVLIALMAWGVFWIDPSVLPPKVGISTASVFTLIAFRFSLKLDLPKISYLTTADWLILAVTLLVFVAFGVAVTTGSLAKVGREDLARRIDVWARWLYSLALAMLCFWILR